MTIKEMEERTGMDRANIRFYEKEGLLSPVRLANGYRDYSDQDADILLRIKLLRSLHVPLDDIRALQHGEKTLSDTMQAHLLTLEQEKNAVSAAEAVCRAMQADHIRFEELNAEKYLAQLARGPKTEIVQYTLPEADAYCPPMHPWRRYFARTLDYNLCILPWELLYLLVFRINPNSSAGKVAAVFAGLLACVTMLLIEPIFLHFFACTPGKRLFGLRIVNDDGSKLSYEEGIQRTWGVIRYGYGFGIPGYDLYRHWKCYKLCTNGEEQDWDEFPLRRRYTIRDTKTWRGNAWFAATTILVFLTALATEISALPPNRGDLTVAEFAENYNYLVDYYSDSTPSYTLDETGAWQEAPLPPGQIVVHWEEEPAGPTPLEYFTDENGHLTGFSISASDGDTFDLLLTDRYFLTALAFVQAQPDGGVFSYAPAYLASRLDDFFQNIDFKTAGIRISFSLEVHSEDTISYTFSAVKEPSS